MKEKVISQWKLSNKLTKLLLMLSLFYAFMTIYNKLKNTNIKTKLILLLWFEIRNSRK